MNYKKIQTDIDQLIQHFGGYWSSLAATTRLLEELAELAESLKANDNHIGEEMADIFLITTCLANQHHYQLTEKKLLAVSVDFLDLLHEAGHIARTINATEGPKKPKSTEKIIPLQESIEKLHAVLKQLALQHNIQLENELNAKIKKIMIRDKDRF